MKHLLLSAVCCIIALSAQAREVTYNVYYTETINIRGELYQYSERYLGTTDVVLNDSHTYELVKIKQVVDTPATANSSNQWKPSERTTISHQLPLSEETLMATNLAKKAESVAKQIYHIRETRMNILAGEAEHMPADGKAMQLVLDELNKQEEALTSMFVGKTIVKNRRKSVTITISDTDKYIKQTLLKFSQAQGPILDNDEQGNDVTLTIVRTTTPVLAAIQPKKGEPVYEDKIISSKVTITYLSHTIYEKTRTL